MSRLLTRKFKRKNNKDKAKLMNKNKIKEKFKDCKKLINYYKNKQKINPSSFKKETKQSIAMKEKSMN